MNLETRLLAKKILENIEFIEQQSFDTVQQAFADSDFTSDQLTSFLTKMGANYVNTKESPKVETDTTTKLERYNLDDTDMEIVDYLVSVLKK
jgi:hypothetical protein